MWDTVWKSTHLIQVVEELLLLLVVERVCVRHIAKRVLALECLRVQCREVFVSLAV